MVVSSRLTGATLKASHVDSDRALTNYQRKLQQKARYPERVRARELAAYALKVGRLARKPCEVCNSADVQMHHDDYSQPLTVRWLCSAHHRLLHSELSAALACPAGTTENNYTQITKEGNNPMRKRPRNNNEWIKGFWTGTWIAIIISTVVWVIMTSLF